MGPAQPLWGLKDEGESLPGPGPVLEARNEPTPQKQMLGLSAPLF